MLSALTPITTIDLSVLFSDGIYLIMFFLRPSLLIISLGSEVLSEMISERFVASLTVVSI